MYIYIYIDVITYALSIQQTKSKIPFPPQKKTRHVSNNKSISALVNIAFRNPYRTRLYTLQHVTVRHHTQNSPQKNPSLSATKVGVQLVPLLNNKLNIDSSRPPGSRNASPKPSGGEFIKDIEKINGNRLAKGDSLVTLKCRDAMDRWITSMWIHRILQLWMAFHAACSWNGPDKMISNAWYARMTSTYIAKSRICLHPISSSFQLKMTIDTPSIMAYHYSHRVIFGSLPYIHGSFPKAFSTLGVKVKVMAILDLAQIRPDKGSTAKISS